MEKRNVALSLATAQEFYNSDNSALREIALQAFTEDELQNKDFRKFKSWKDIEDYLADIGINFSRDTKCMTRNQIALLKLNYIRQVLNRGRKMSFTKGNIWYPYTPFITKNSKHYNTELGDGSIKEVAKFMVNGKEYRLLGGLAYIGGDAGLGYFNSRNGVGLSPADIGFLGCASAEIAEHMSTYFAKEIFEAKYGDFIPYRWL